MITEKIKALFQFIEYLNSNIENFNQYNNLINELNLLNDNRQKLKPQKNYRDKLKHNDIQAELESKNKTRDRNHGYTRNRP